jgi:hypothetical protein
MLGPDLSRSRSSGHQCGVAKRNFCEHPYVSRYSGLHLLESTLVCSWQIKRQNPSGTQDAQGDVERYLIVNSLSSEIWVHLSTY